MTDRNPTGARGGLGDPTMTGGYGGDTDLTSPDAGGYGEAGDPSSESGTYAGSGLVGGGTAPGGGSISGGATVPDRGSIAGSAASAGSVSDTGSTSGLGSMSESGGEGGESAGAGRASGAAAAVDTVKEHLAEAGSKASSVASQGIEGAASGLTKAADLLRSRGDGGGAAEGATGAVAAKLEGASGYLQGGGGQVMSDLEAMVRRNPTQALLVAAGIGFLISKIGK